MILENNPYLHLQDLSSDRTWKLEKYNRAFEIRGRGLKGFHKNVIAGDLVLRNLPERLDALENCDYIAAAWIKFVGSFSSVCQINARSSPSSYSLIYVHTIDGERVLDPEAFCQTNPEYRGISIVKSEVILPEACFSRKG